eukprot:TRINITY_DN19522_c0_g1_i1.p1 TRINITY_DN19522_c0_g1~~TRINITY_DN19522_c0_g1_i1.p1  ORF type:complete len:411 (+),score=107.19 TRINITY_DN19522_c0_g1_i1:83-1234(+)
MVGLAVLSMPNAAGGAGLVPFWTVFAVCFATFFFSLKSFADAACVHDCPTYQAVLEAYIGKSSSYMMQAIWILMALMVIASYLIVAGDAFHKFQAVSDVFSHFSLMCISAGIMLPISLPKALHSVRIISLFSNLAIVLIFIAIIANWAQGDHDGDKEDIGLWPNDTARTLSAGPLVAGGFGCHINGIRGLHELKNKDDFTKVIVIVGVAATTFYSLFTVSALCAYGGDVDGDIQKDLQGTPGGIARVAMGTAVILKAPLILQPARDMIVLLLPVTDGVVCNVLLTAGFIALSLGFAFVLGSLSTAMTLLSGTCGVAITWLLPGVIMWYAMQTPLPEALPLVNDAPSETRPGLLRPSLINSAICVWLLAGGVVLVGLTAAAQFA